MFTILKALFLNTQFATSAFDLVRRIIIDKWLNKPHPVDPNVVKQMKQQNAVIKTEAKIAQQAASGETEQQLIESLDQGKF